MASVRDVVAYLCTHYPHKSELSKARLTKMVYLADWRCALVAGHQITPIAWEFNHYGPYVDDVINAARSDSSFQVVRSTNAYGSLKETVTVKRAVAYPSLTDGDMAVLDFVVAGTAPKSWDSFIRLVYSTYPVVTQERYTTLDLVDLAKKYKDEQAKGLFDGQ